MSRRRLCIFGEVLYDHFPDGTRVLGGAPFNVAWHLNAFGQAPYFISRVGEDREGEEIRQAMQDWGMDTNGLQSDAALPTGRVAVTFDNGEPNYDIVKPCAYDAIAPPIISDWDVLYHGSLAVRTQTSMDALQHMKIRDQGSVFVDVNLRPPWWDAARLDLLLKSATWVKLNNDELRKLNNSADNDADAARSFLSKYRLKGLILTHGVKGAEFITSDGNSDRVEPQHDTAVIDTVGAGDAFASVMILGLLNDWAMSTTLQRAQSFASHIVGRRGATVSERSLYRGFVEAWNLPA